jgi:hypothetical protein
MNIALRDFEAPLGIALVDSAGLIVAVNEAWRRFTAANNRTAPPSGIGP